jgi:hypothetical protein
VLLGIVVVFLRRRGQSAGSQLEPYPFSGGHCIAVEERG